MVVEVGRLPRVAISLLFLFPHHGLGSCLTPPLFHIYTITTADIGHTAYVRCGDVLCALSSRGGAVALATTWTNQLQSDSERPLALVLGKPH